MRALHNTRALQCPHKTLRTCISIYSNTSSPTVSQIAAVSSLYSQIKKQERDFLVHSGMKSETLLLLYSDVFISYSERKVPSEVFCTAVLNKLQNMKC